MIRVRLPHPHLRTPRVALLAAVLALAPGVARAQGLPRAAPEEVCLSADALARVTPALQAYVDSGRYAGVVGAVARHGKLAYLQAVGRANAEREAPLSADAIFRIYSMTKPVTAAAILRLRDQGKLHLDDPVSRYIPAFADVRVYGGGPAARPMLRAPDRPITLRHLLTHTAGLTYGAFGDTPVDSIYRAAEVLDPSRDLAEFADNLARLPLLFSPGERWVYSVSIDLLGRVVEVASGRPLDRYLEEEIFRPLGMGNTTFRIRPGTRGRVVPIHQIGEDGRLRPQEAPGSTFEPRTRFLSGGGGLLSTPADYLRFAQMLLNGGELDGVRILEPESVALLASDHTGPLDGVPGGAFGLAVAVQVEPASAENPSAPGTYRWAGLANTFFWIDPANDLVGMVWAQHLPSRAHPIEREFKQLVYRALVPAASCGTRAGSGP